MAHNSHIPKGKKMHGSKKAQSKRKIARSVGFKNVTEAKEYGEKQAKEILRTGRPLVSKKTQEKAESIIESEKKKGKK